MPSSPLRIAFILPSLDIGGMERLVVALAHRFVADGHICAVFCCSHAGVQAADLQREGIAVYVTPFRRAVDNLHPADLVDALRDFRPSVMHSHSGVWLAAAISSRRLGVPLCHTEHGLESAVEPLKVRAQKWLAARLTGATVAVSAPLQTALADQISWPTSRVLRIDNGVDTELFGRPDESLPDLRQSLVITDEEVVVGCVARLDRLKGVDVLMRAVGMMKTPINRFRVVVAGDGAQRAEVESLARSTGARVDLLGMRKDVPALLQLFDIFVLPSRSEGLPLAVLEAMAAGCCVVATSVGEVPTVLDDGGAGVIVSPENPEELAAALDLVVNDAVQRNLFARAGAVRVRSLYDLAAAADAYENCYREIIRGQAKGSIP